MKWVPLGLRVQTWNIWQKSNISGSWHAWISSNISNFKCKNKAEINVTSVSRSCKIMNIFAKDRIFHNKPDQDAAPRSSKFYTVQDNWVTNMVILNLIIRYKCIQWVFFNEFRMGKPMEVPKEYAWWKWRHFDDD